MGVGGVTSLSTGGVAVLGFPRARLSESAEDGASGLDAGGVLSVIPLPEFAGTRGFTGATGLADTALSLLSLPLPPPQAVRRRARAATPHDRCAGVFMDDASRNVVLKRRNVAECRGAKLRPKAWGCNASCGRHRLLRVDL